MEPEEIIEEIKGLVFDPDTLERFERIELLEDLLDKVSIYALYYKRYEQLFETLQEEEEITPFPEDWKHGEVWELFQKAHEAEREMFAVLSRFKRYPEIKKEDESE